MQYTDILKNSIENLAHRIDIMVSSDIQMRINENKQIFCLIVCAIVFMGKQGLKISALLKILKISWFTQVIC